MTISRAQMYRQLYQMGGMGQMGIESLSPMQPAMQPAMQSAMYSPLQNNYSGMPMMANGGRMGYQEGDIAMSQPEGIMGAMSGSMPQEAGDMMQPPMQDQMQGQMMPAAGGEEQGQNALLTIIQLLIEQGIDPETAKELAGRILEAFSQGGAPAVEEFANQLEQEEMQQEGMQEPMMMAGGGLTSIDRARDMLQSRAPSGEFLAYINPQEAGILRSMGGAGQDVNVRGVPSFFVKKIGKAISGAVKGVASAVKSIAKSPIGMIALSIAAPYAIGAFAPGFATFGGTGFLGGALRAGISNLAVQGITTGKINPKQALLAAAAGGALSSFQGAGTVGQTTGITPEGINLDAAYGDMSSNLSSNLSSTTGITPEGINLRAAYESPSISSTGNVPSTATASTGFGTTIDRGITSIKDFGTKLMDSPLQTLSGVGSDALKLVKDNKELALLGGTLALSALDQQPGESDDAYKLRAQTDPRVAQYITQYGGAAKVYSPGASGLYAMEGAVDPFAGRSSYAANGGRIGYEDGSMPMGEPRRNPAGIMELDYRAKGGFVPPIGIKEKADDIPAMLSNNEFVFTADAVRAAGGGSVNKGAQKMYGLMKQLESGIA